MAYDVVELQKARSVGRTGTPVVHPLQIDANEMGLLFFSFRINELENIDALNPVTLAVETSFDGGENWEPVAGESVIEAPVDGTYTWKKDQTSSEIIGPDVRLVWSTTAVGGVFSVSEIQKSEVDANAPVFNSVSLNAGAITAETGFTRNGAPQEVVQDTTTPANNRPLPVTPMDATTGQPLDLSSGAVATVGKLPEGANAFTVARPDTVTEVISYRTGGIAGAVVKTVTVIYTDSTKKEIASLEES